MGCVMSLHSFCKAAHHGVLCFDLPVQDFRGVLGVSRAEHQSDVGLPLNLLTSCVCRSSKTGRLSAWTPRSC